MHKTVRGRREQTFNEQIEYLRKYLNMGKGGGANRIISIAVDLLYTVVKEEKDRLDKRNSPPLVPENSRESL